MKYVYMLTNLRPINVGLRFANTNRTIELKPFQTIESEDPKEFEGFQNHPYYRYEVIEVPDSIDTQIGDSEEEIDNVEQAPTQQIQIDNEIVDLPDSFDMEVSEITYEVRKVGSTKLLFKCVEGLLAYREISAFILESGLSTAKSIDSIRRVVKRRLDVSDSTEYAGLQILRIRK